MPELEDRISRLDQRLEVLIAGMSRLNDYQRELGAMLAELKAWLEQPPSNDLPELLRSLVATIDSTNDAVDALREAVMAGFERIEKALSP